MTPEVRDTLLRLLLPAIGIVVILFAANRRGLSLGDDLGLRLPSFRQGFLWLVVFLALAITEEVLWRALGQPAPEPWGDKYSRSIIWMRVLAMVVMAPIAEELLFRGLFFHMAANTFLKQTGAVFATAALFAAFHFQYGLWALLFVLVDGLFYGTVRAATGSIILTMALHAIGNAYAAYQRFP